MNQFLIRVLGASVLLSILNLYYLVLAVACIIAIVINSYLDTKTNTLESQKKDIENLAESIKASIRNLETEQSVLKMKLNNIANPGRKQ